MKVGFCFWVLILALTFSACGASPTSALPVLTPPAIGIQLTGGYCPSIEVQLGTHIAWTNVDNVDHMLIIERVNEQGIVVESGGMPLLQPGTTFSILLTEAGQYTCSLDRKQFGTINVVSQAPVIAPSSQILPTVAAGTPQCVETFIPAMITELQPARPSLGSEVTVIGNGGLMQDSCGSVNESARSFTLYMDTEPAGDFMCYVNRCESKLRLPNTLTQGSHCLSTQKDVCEFQFEVVK